MKKTLLKGSIVLAAALSLAAQVPFAQFVGTDVTVVSAEEMKLKDGTYTAVSDADERGWALKHVIEVKDGKIASSKFDYVNDKGEMKSANEQYNKMMAEKSKVSFADAAKKLDEALVKGQSADVEVVSGATNSTDAFKFSTKVLLKAAAEGKTEEINISKLTLQDGTYTLEADADKRGWTTKFTLEVKDGKVAKADYDMYKDGKRKSEDPEYNKMMAEKSKVSFADAVKKLNEEAVSGKVEVVSGATNTSKAFTTYYNELVQAAKLGQKDVIKAKVMAE